MSAAVRKVTEQVEVAGRAAEEARAALRAALVAFRELSTIDPRKFFGHSVREHREVVYAFDSVLRDMCFEGRDIEIVAGGVGLGREAATTIRAVHEKLRIARTLAAVLGGDRSALESETGEVRSAVEQLIAARASESESHWTREERDDFSKDPRPLSTAFEARLNGS